MSTALSPMANRREGEIDEFDGYKSIPGLAVMAIVFGLLSLLALLNIWPLKAIPLLGLVAGALALWKIRSRPEEFRGNGMALTGLALALVCLVSGSALGAYIYVTECPDGYNRISFEKLQYEPEEPQKETPKSAQPLEGERVFIKGYAYQPAGGHIENLKEFMLVRDKGDCCFGGNPKSTDMIYVKLKGGLELGVWSMDELRVGGKFHLQRRSATDGITGECMYELEADYLK